MRKPGTKRTHKREPEVVTKTVTKNFFNQEQLDEFAGLLRDANISVKDAEVVAAAFCDHFKVKEKARFLGIVSSYNQHNWETVT